MTFRTVSGSAEADPRKVAASGDGAWHWMLKDALDMAERLAASGQDTTAVMRRVRELRDKAVAAPHFGTTPASVEEHRHAVRRTADYSSL